MVIVSSVACLAIALDLSGVVFADRVKSNFYVVAAEVIPVFLIAVLQGTDGPVRR